MVRNLPKIHPLAQKPTKASAFVAIAVLAGLANLSGCRRAAFNEFYVENMAGEIRALEDRIYEYDSAYTALEVENEDLRRAIESLRNKQQTQPDGDWGGRSLLPAPVEVKPRSNNHSKPSQSMEIGPSRSVPPEEIDLSPRPKSNRPNNAAKPPAKNPPPSSSTPVETLPPPAALAEPPALPEENGSAFPSNGRNRDGLKMPNPKDLDIDFEPPSGTIHSTHDPNLNNGASKRSGSKTTSLVSAQSTYPKGTVDLEEPPKMTLPSLNKESIVQGRIALPTILQSGASEGAGYFGKIALASSEQVVAPKVVVDQKLVEIGFHPTLCRGHNFNEIPGDDGLYLVVTPKNASGDVLNQIGRLTVVVEETDGEYSRRIAAWEVTPEELEESLEPIGLSQGFHLSLPFEEIQPEGTRVQVFLKYVLKDGRSLVNRKEVNLRRPGVRQTSWTPR